MRTPEISLILATVGRTDELTRMFESLATQTFSDFEVVVVDQNEDDRLRGDHEGEEERHAREGSRLTP